MVDLESTAVWRREREEREREREEEEEEDEEREREKERRREREILGRKNYKYIICIYRVFQRMNE